MGQCLFCAVQAARRSHSAFNWVSRRWLCARAPSSWNGFHMAGLETFPVGRAQANGSVCKKNRLSSSIRSPVLSSVCCSLAGPSQLGLVVVPLPHRHMQGSDPAAAHCSGSSDLYLPFYLSYVCWQATTSFSSDSLCRSRVLCGPFQADQSERSRAPGWCF